MPYNNDLVGKDKPWGPESGLCEWKRSLYYRYHSMVRRCENPKDKRYPDYGGSGIKCKFTSLSQYYDTLTKDPLWDNFKQNSSLYDIDKDIKCGHGSDYSPDTVMIVLKKVNTMESLVRCGVPVSRPGVAQKIQDSRKRSGALDKLSHDLGRPVMGISPIGEVFEWCGASIAAKQFCLSTSTIQQACSGGYYRRGVWESISHTKTKGKLKGWTFYWKEDYERMIANE